MSKQLYFLYDKIKFTDYQLKRIHEALSKTDEKYEDRRSKYLVEVQLKKHQLRDGNHSLYLNTRNHRKLLRALEADTGFHLRLSKMELNMLKKTSNIPSSDEMNNKLSVNSITTDESEIDQANEDENPKSIGTEHGCDVIV